MVVIYFLCVLSALPAVIPVVQEPWDYNLLVRLKDTGKGYGYPGQLTLETRGNVRALPGRVFNHRRTLGVEDQSFTTPCCRNWEKSGWIKVKSREAEKSSPLLDFNFRWNNKSAPLAEVWAVKGTNASMYSPKVTSARFKYNRNNITVPISVTVVARLSIETTLNVIVQHADGTVKVIETINGNADNSWILRSHRHNTEIQRNASVQFGITVKQPADWVTPVLVQWVTISTPSDIKTNLGTISGPENVKNTYYEPLTATANVLERDPVCLHGGEIDVTGGRCKCRSGFAGTVCERGCGPNRYGLNCGALCSAESAARQCRGILDCSKDGCKCLPGLRGATCNQTCVGGWYGNSCERRCGHCAGNEPCDKYTGRCEGGCEDGFHPPFCLKESCGLPSAGHVDGAPPEITYWHSAIYEKKQGTYKAVCSGSLIAPRFLLSAAWCFYSESSSSVKSAARFLVLFGTDERYEFTESTLPKGIQAQTVASLHVPSLYRGSQRSHADDIALVEIVRPVRITPEVAPVCIDVQDGDEDDDIVDGDVGHVAGWGDCADCRINITEVEYVAHTSCLNQVAESLLLAIGPEKFCGQLVGEDTEESSEKDSSDIGSGFMYFRKSNAWSIYGVKSAAAPDTKSRIAGYTSVRNYADWIMTKMNDLDVKYAVLRNT